jgi:hypothetical protein
MVQSIEERIDQIEYQLCLLQSYVDRLEERISQLYDNQLRWNQRAFILSHRSALVEAVQTGNLPRVKELCEVGLSPFDRVVALIAAQEARLPQIVEYLLTIS